MSKMYLTDNGRALCSEHLGYTAKGRDISGQEILLVESWMLGTDWPDGFNCEQPGCAAGVRP